MSKLVATPADNSATPPTYYVWAGVNDPSAVPDRLSAGTCPHCYCLVPTATADKHTAWHRRSATTTRTTETAR